VLPPADHDPARGLLSTAGRPSLGWEVRLGERGEIQVRGAAPLPRYWGDPGAMSAALTNDGFYRTGDVGTIDSQGYLTIVDRLRDVIITGGENVFPAEVEAVLAGHAAVADVAVIGIPDDRWGETVHAVVVPRTGPYTGDQFTAELIGYARERLAGFKCPTGVTLVPSLPRNPTGRLRRASLRAPFWVGHDRRV
jgi:acyl-CoA synthetase (AMP-forming)/AMP-acid ligase II